jgi:endonuclease/exonuclease/phosphatase family metal-dependent hydrolase
MRPPRFLRHAWVIAGLWLLGSCGSDKPQDQGFRVLTLNMYIGFGQDVISGDLTDPEQLRMALERALAAFRQTDSTGRINGMARYIAQEEPDVVGLQEVSSIVLTRGTPDPNDDAPFVDYLGTLLDAIAKAGGPHYQSFVQPNNTLEGTIDLVGRLEPFRFQEADVILVRPDVAAQKIGNGLQYRTLLPIGPVITPTGIVERFYVRGALHVRATRQGQTLELFNTHLEVNGEGGVGTPVQNAQARELVDYIQADASASATAVILTGDMNGRPDSTTHSVIAGAGFQDTFAQVGQGPGLTCCQAPLLDNTTDQAVERIDYVFCKGSCSAVESQVVLNKRVPRSDGTGSVWPTDHFGVLSSLEFP